MAPCRVHHGNHTRQIADTSGTAIGGTILQMIRDLSRVKIMLTHPRRLTAPQQSRPPLVQEAYIRPIGSQEGDPRNVRLGKLDGSRQPHAVSAHRDWLGCDARKVGGSDSGGWVCEIRSEIRPINRQARSKVNSYIARTTSEAASTAKQCCTAQSGLGHWPS
jgi:hypothetical protein